MPGLAGWGSALAVAAAAALAVGGAEAAALARRSLGKGPTRIELENYLDLQYAARIDVGSPPQRISGIIDTGSFELVVFDRACEGCGGAGVYASRGSGTYKKGRLVTELSYGSGEVSGDQAFDHVSVGGLKPFNQSFWLIDRAKMPLLAHSGFHSILGVGPPEAPAADAWEMTEKAVKDAANLVRQNHLPRLPRKTIRELEGDLATALDISGRSTLLRSFGVQSFSICLGRRPGSPGLFVWNDTLPGESPKAFVRLQVVGKHSWTVRLTDARLVSPTPALKGMSPPIGCERGCAAVIDSGTSLLVAPADAVSLLQEAVETVGYNCGSLQDLPNLVLTIDGSQFLIGPDAYATKSRSQAACRLQCSATVSQAQSNEGPLWILGMPFLRRYYTTFQLGQDQSSRSLLVAASNEDCSVGAKRGLSSLSASKGEARAHLRSFDPEAAIVTPMAHKAATQSFVKL